MNAFLPARPAGERPIDGLPTEISVVKSQSDLMDAVLLLTYENASHHGMASHSITDSSGGCRSERRKLFFDQIISRTQVIRYLRNI